MHKLKLGSLCGENRDRNSYVQEEKMKAPFGPSAMLRNVAELEARRCYHLAHGSDEDSREEKACQEVCAKA